MRRDAEEYDGDAGSGDRFSGVLDFTFSISSLQSFSPSRGEDAAP